MEYGGIVQFHLKEYEFLCEDIRKLNEQSGQSLTFAVTVCGISLAWILSNNNISNFDDSRYIPFLISAIFGLLSASFFIRSYEKIAYIKKLERELGAASLGFQRSRKIGSLILLVAVYNLAWLTLNIATGYIAFLR